MHEEEIHTVPKMALLAELWETTSSGHAQQRGCHQAQGRKRTLQKGSPLCPMHSQAAPLPSRKRQFSLQKREYFWCSEGTREGRRESRGARKAPVPASPGADHRSGQGQTLKGTVCWAHLTHMHTLLTAGSSGAGTQPPSRGICLTLLLL